MSRNRSAGRASLPPYVEPATPLLSSKPELMGVRHLTAEHIGRFIYLPGTATGAAAREEPSVLAFGGRLVGIRPGEYSSAPPTRILVIQQGNDQAALPLRVDAAVLVSPRTWS